MTNPSQPLADVSEFALPGRMRELAARILWDLFNPLREKVARIERTSADETAASELRLEEEANKLADAMATAKKELAAQRDFIQATERREISPIEQELNRYTDAKATLARQRESLLGQFKSRALAIPAVDASAGGNNPPLIVDEAVRIASGQFDDLQRAFRGPILSDFQRKKGILRKWQWIIGVFLGLFALLLSLCFIIRNPPVGYTVLTAIGLGVFARFAWKDLNKNNIPQDSFFFGISLAINEVQTGFKRFSTLAASVETSLPKLIADFQQQKATKISGFDAQRKQADQTFERKRALIMSDGNAAEERHKVRMQTSQAERRANSERLSNEYSPIVAALHQEVETFWNSTGFASAEWDTANWKEWSPDLSPEFAARIGTLVISADDLQSTIPGVDFIFRLPALIPFSEGRCLLLNVTGAARDAAADALQSVATRALANTPPGKARFTLIDPVGLGQNVADFMHLGDFNRELINGKAWTEPQHIEQQLTKITEEMETVIQTFLRKKYASIQEYNKEHNEVAEPFRFLVIFDFPVNFTESSARRLISIVKNGPRCGVYTLMLMDSSQKLPYGFDMEELRRLAVVFESQGVVSHTHRKQDARPIESTLPTTEAKATPPPIPASLLPAPTAPSWSSANRFAVVLKSVPDDKKIAVIKAVRSINGLDLAEAKEVVETVPNCVLEGVTIQQANAAKGALEESGAIVDIVVSPSPPPLPERQQSEAHNSSQNERSALWEIRGPDDRKYGPIGIEKFREWIVEGRVNAQTRARIKGTNEWREAIEFPALMKLFAEVES